MRVEGGLSELKGLRSADLARGEKRNRRREKRSPPMPRGLIQKLFDSCREVFSDAATGVVPAPDGVARVKSVLGTFVALPLSPLYHPGFRLVV